MVYLPSGILLTVMLPLASETDVISIPFTLAVTPIRGSPLPSSLTVAFSVFCEYALYAHMAAAMRENIIFLIFLFL